MSSIVIGAPPVSGAGTGRPRTVRQPADVDVKRSDLWIKGSKKETARCQKALDLVAPGVPWGFVLSTICGIQGEYPDTWGDFMDFDTQCRMDWRKLHERNQETKDWVISVKPNLVSFARGGVVVSEEPLAAWTRE